MRYRTAMTRTLVRYRCANCGCESAKWLGRCPDCGEWGSFGDDAVPAGPGRAAASVPPVPISQVDGLGARPVADRNLRTRPCARRRARCRIRHAARRRTGHGQEHAAAPSTRRDGRARQTVLAGQRRGIGGPSALARRPARHPGRRSARRLGDLAAGYRRASSTRSSRRCARSTRFKPCTIPTGRDRPVRSPKCATARSRSCGSPRNATSRWCSSVTSPRTARSPARARSNTSSTPCSRSRATGITHCACCAR